MELLLVMAIIGILASIATPRLRRAREMAEVAKAVADVRIIASELYDYWNGHERFPESLADIGRAGFLDPWGRPYVYLNLTDLGQGGGTAKARKDRFLHPLNSDFDLYSRGVDGETSPPLSQKVSHDDIVRANDGGFIGLASEY